MDERWKQIGEGRWAAVVDRLWLGGAALALVAGVVFERLPLPDRSAACPALVLGMCGTALACAVARRCRRQVEQLRRQLDRLATARDAELDVRLREAGAEAELQREDLGVVRSRLQAQAEALAKSNRDLEQRNREIESFYHVVSHELRTPLTAIREFLAIVRDGVTGEINDAQRECVESAIESCNHMRRCVDDLFDVARLETGRLTIRPTRVAPRALLERAATRLRPFAAQTGVRIVEEIAEPLPDIQADTDRFVQIVGNLLHNAIKFSDPDTAVRLRARPCQGPTGHEELLVEIADEGCGIPADQLLVIFDRLAQVCDDALQTQGGLGLGLPLCRQLVEQHHGRIEIESRRRYGTTVRFTIPATRERPPVVLAPRSRPTEVLQR